METCVSLTRRSFVKRSLVVLGTSLLAACAPKGGEGPAKPTQAPAGTGAGEAVTLDYWFCWSGRYAEIQRKFVLDEFEKEFGGKIKINDLPVPSEITQKLLTAVAAGTPPDVANCFGALISLGVKGAFIPINEYVAASKTVNLDAIYPAALKSCIWKGVQYGFPYNCSSEMLIFNVDLFSQAGLDATKGPETWDEFTEMSKKLVKFNTDGSLQVAAFTNWFPRHLAAWFWINGGDAFNADTGELTINDPRNVEGLQTVINYAWDVYGDIAKADEFAAGAGSAAESPFCIGAQAVTYGGDWDPSTYHEWCPSVKIWPAQFPHGPQGTETVAVYAGDYIGICKGAKHPDEAYQFAEWMCMKGNLMWTKAGVDTNCIAGDAGVVRSDWPDIFGDKAAEIAKWWALSAQKARPVENFPAYSFMNAELQRVFDLAFHKQMTAKEALDEAQATVAEEIAKTS